MEQSQNVEGDRSRPIPKRKDIVHSKEYCHKFAYEKFMNSLPWNIRSEARFRMKYHLEARMIEKPEYTELSNQRYVSGNEHINQFLMSNIVSKTMKELNVVYENERDGVIQAFNEIMLMMTSSLRDFEKDQSK